MAHNGEQAVPTGTAAHNDTSATGQGSRWVNWWTIYGLTGATAIALILAVAGWSRASTHAGEAEALKGQVADLKGQLTASQGQLTSTQGQLTTVQGQLASVTGERDALKPLTAQVASLGEEIDGFQVERSMMLTERNGIVQKLGAVTWARDVGDSNAVQLQKQVATLTSQRDALRPLVEEVDRLESLRANLLTERNELVQRVGGVAWARDIAEAKLADLEKGIQAARADRERVLSDMATMETAVGTKEALTEQVAKAQADAKEIEGQLANLMAQREALNGEIAQGQQRVTELQGAVDLASQNLAAIGNEVAQRSQALNTLRQQQQEATRQAEAAKAVFLDAEKQLTLLRDQMVNQAEVLRAAAKPVSGGSDGGGFPAGGPTAGGSSQPTQ